MDYSLAEGGIVTVSLGVVSLAPSKQYAPEDLVRLADSALYQAKHAGRNCVKSTTNSPPAAPGDGHPRHLSI